SRRFRRRRNVAAPGPPSAGLRRRIRSEGRGRRGSRRQTAWMNFPCRRQGWKARSVAYDRNRRGEGGGAGEIGTVCAPPLGRRGQDMDNWIRVAAAAWCATVLMTGMAGAQSKTVLKLGHNADEQDLRHQAALKFAAEVEALTNGALAVQVFPDEALGKEPEL